MSLASLRSLEPHRRLLTVNDVLRMQKTGVIDSDERLELFEGVLIRMQSKNYAHERIKIRLNREIVMACPEGYAVGIETTAYLSNITALDPDISLIPDKIDIRHILGADIPLVVEIADSSLARDRGPKAALYAKYGVRELWVIDARKLKTYRFASPVGGVWQETSVIGPDEPLSHPILKGMSIRLADV
jgi:Uma2 family endonuclease